MGIKDKAKQVAKNVAHEGVYDTAWDGVQKIPQEVAKRGGEKVGQMIADRATRAQELKRYRTQMLAFLRLQVKEHDPKAYQKLQKRRHARHFCKARKYKPYTPYNENAEDRMHDALTAVFMAFVQSEPVFSVVQARDFFCELAHENDKDFDMFVEAVLEDEISRVIKFLKQLGKMSGKQAEKLVPFIKSTLGDIKQFALSTAVDVVNAGNDAAAASVPHIRNFRAWKRRKIWKEKS